MEEYRECIKGKEDRKQTYRQTYIGGGRESDKKMLEKRRKGKGKKRRVQ